MIENVPTPELVQELARRRRDSNITEIIRVVGDEMGVSEEEILDYGKEPTVCEARALAMSLASQNHTSIEVARMFNRVNHSTVLSAKKRTDQIIQSSDRMKRISQRIIKRLYERKILKAKG